MTSVGIKYCEICQRPITSGLVCDICRSVLLCLEFVKSHTLCYCGDAFCVHKVMERSGEWVIAYQCFNCGGWHIGHPDSTQKLVHGIGDRKINWFPRVVRADEREEKIK